MFTKNRSITLLFIIAIIISLLAMTVSAAGTDSASDVCPVSFNEYDYIQTIRQSNSQELEALGLNTQKAEEIVCEFEEALAVRASLSDEQLTAYGYDDFEIELFHKYVNGEELSSNELKALSSTCTGDITCQWITPRAAQFTYTWTWNRCPIVTLSDCSALRWIAYNDESIEIGVEQTSSSMNIQYYTTGNAAGDGAFAYTQNGSNEPNLDFNTLNMQFLEFGSMVAPSGMIFDCYAKIGKVSVAIKIPTGVDQTIDHIFVAGLYGHTLIGVGSPSVSVSPGSCAISFSANTSVDAIAPCRGTITQGSTTIKYW